MSTELRHKFDDTIYVSTIKGNNSNLTLSGRDGNHIVIDGVIDFSSATFPDGTLIGNVTGPNSSGANSVAVFDSTTGKVIKDSLVSISDTGNIRGSALHNNPDSQGDATEQDIRSGTYTPTLYNITNIATSTAYACQWMRVGNVVTVSGRVDITASGNGLTELGITLPVASAFNAPSQSECAGTAYDIINPQGAIIVADGINARARLQFLATGPNNHHFWFSFTYVVV